MKVLFVASECTPFIKTGGLADVIGSLPKYLQGLGNVDVRVIMPKYSDINFSLTGYPQWQKSIEISMEWRKQFCGIETLEYNNITFYFIDNQYYFNRPGLYGYYDDGERFAYFSKAVVDLLPHLQFKPDIIHCHDWHSAMVPVLIDKRRNDDFYKDIKTIYTIHNLKFQGIFPKEVLYLMELDDSYFTFDKLEYYNNINFMKGGIIYSHCVTTVSPTYVEEIKNPFYGEGLEEVLKYHQYKLKGILNGLDYEEYNPSTDSNLYVKYSLKSLQGKTRNKKMLQKELGLVEDKNIPLIAVISRLTEQKGFYLIKEVLDEILQMHIQMVVLGVGDKEFEEMFKGAENRYPNKLRVLLKFDEGLARKIYGASDLFLMPSLFEPCGLSQLIALRYGSLPLVRETGGLKDTVIPYNQFTGEGNGFSFTNYNAHDMLYTLKWAVDIYYNDKVQWRSLVKRAMESDYSWEKSAQEYLKLYGEIKG
ncbi:glycogen synthase GlgA [Anaerobranca gottschalkii]|uniref:Glycogen synthase n=1 Tax=Anaerobranca gottschalkii DSM 13577 TaxID=1120990 RepID=A0A1I0AB15_9FIRM|nr:glycogen synthase GlgA [Anaerobranca gottschalkii]SES91358.1 starch synthase [Anaerobranca gottschalkii DSM 13577]